MMTFMLLTVQEAKKLRSSRDCVHYESKYFIDVARPAGTRAS